MGTVFTIDRIILHNFKGVSHENLCLNDADAFISGKNGTGKSTIECGYFWLMSDCSETLVSNPAIFPLNAEEVKPSVEITGHLNGKEITLERIVKKTVRKAKREGDADSVSFSSTYLVNSVEYGLRDFKAKLNEYGITDNFLALSHPDMFLSQKKDDMRSLLFSLAKGKSDYEVATLTEGAEDAAELLKNYSYDEVQAMQNASIRKIKEEYGKDGEILRAKIEGLESAKVDIDFAELELYKNLKTEELASIVEEQSKAKANNDLVVKLKNLDAELKGRLASIEETERKEAESIREKVKANRNKLTNDLSSIESNIASLTYAIELGEKAVKGYEETIATLEQKIKDIGNEIFNENDAICPTCHRTFELDRVAEIKADFEKGKAERIANAEKQIDSVKSLMAIKKADIDSYKSEIPDKEKAKAEIQRVLAQADNLNGSMEPPHLHEDEKKLILAQIESNNRALESNPEISISDLVFKERAIRDEISQTEIKLSQADKNCQIDEKIADLRTLQITYEQNKANAEKILYQLDLISKKKNELLTDEINGHFGLVKWQFFEYQKNGTYKNCCNVTVDGKELGAALNNALCIRAKIDICSSLQNIFDCHLPIWIDNAEALDTENLSKIDTKGQLIMLKVTDGNLSVSNK